MASNTLPEGQILKPQFGFDRRQHYREHSAIHIVHQEELLRRVGVGRSDKLSLKKGTFSFDRQNLSIVGHYLITAWLRKLVGAGPYAPDVGI